MRIGRIIVRLAAIILIFVLLMVAGSRATVFSSDASFWDGEGERIEVVRTSRRIMDIPVCLVPDDGTGGGYSDYFCDAEKKRVRIQISHLNFMNSVFHMILYPLLLFVMIIRRFGKNLHVLLWRIISYIHIRDYGEYYLLSCTDCFESRNVGNYLNTYNYSYA